MPVQIVCIAAILAIAVLMSMTGRGGVYGCQRSVLPGRIGEKERTEDEHGDPGVAGR